MILKTLKFNKILKILNIFSTLSKVFVSEMSRFVRVYSSGGGKLYFIVNNETDLRIIQNVDIEKDIEIDSVYLISELSNIVENVLNYEDLKLEDDIIYFDDGKFSLMKINLPQDKIDQVFYLDMEETDNSFVVDTEIEKEIKDLFSILKLKAETVNSYFYDEGQLYFIFPDYSTIYIKKNSLLSFMITDMFSLRMISVILLKNLGKRVNYTSNNENLIIDSDDFYLETKIYKYDKNAVSYLKQYFEDLKIINEVTLKLEFFNFVNAINSFDEDSILNFSENSITVNSKMVNYQYRKFLGEFNFKENDKKFVISTKILFKILSYAIKNIKDDEISFKLLKIKNNDFIYFNINDVEILTEIG